MRCDGQVFDDNELHKKSDKATYLSIVQMQWNYDTQPYVPYTVPKNIRFVEPNV